MTERGRSRTKVPRASLSCTMLDDPDYIELMQDDAGRQAYALFTSILIAAKVADNGGTFQQSDTVLAMMIRWPLDGYRKAVATIQERTNWIVAKEPGLRIRSFRKWNSGWGGKRDGAGRKKESSDDAHALHLNESGGIQPPALNNQDCKLDSSTGESAGDSSETKQHSPVSDSVSVSDSDSVSSSPEKDMSPSGDPEGISIRKTGPGIFLGAEPDRGPGVTAQAKPRSTTKAKRRAPTYPDWFEPWWKQMPSTIRDDKAKAVKALGGMEDGFRERAMASGLAYAAMVRANPRGSWRGILVWINASDFDNEPDAWLARAMKATKSSNGRRVDSKVGEKYRGNDDRY